MALRRRNGHGARREVVAITGASAGVGRAVAHEFARHGARVALLARGEKGLADACDEVRALGGEALLIPVDVADAQRVEAAAQTVEDRFGPLDVWVNNAMSTVFARVAETTPEEFTRATEVTYLGTVHGTMAALRRMQARDRGTIVQVGSALSYRAIPLQAAYCGAKFAIRGFTDSLRVELMAAGSAVHVTMVQLPGLNTPQFNWCRAKLPGHPMPVPPIFQPEVAARAIHYAAHHRRRETYCGSSAVKAIVGNKLAPSLADRYLARTGIDAQQMRDRPLATERAGNLFDPLEEQAATHGIFDEQARSDSAQLWATEHRSLLAGGAACLVAAAIARLAR